MIDLKDAGAFIGRFSRTTALAPILIVDVLLFILCAVVVPFTTPLIQILIVVPFILAILVTLYQIVYFTQKDPDRLAWQHQVLQKYLIDKIYGDESHDMTRAAIAAGIVNPKKPMLDSDKLELPPGAETQNPEEESPLLS